MSMKVRPGSRLSELQFATLAEAMTRDAAADAGAAVERWRENPPRGVAIDATSLRARLAGTDVDVEALEREWIELHRRDPAAARERVQRFLNEHPDVISRAAEGGRRC